MLPSKGGFFLDPSVAVVVETPFLSYLRQHLGSLGDSLITYYVPKRNRYCLGVLRDPVAGRVYEIKSWTTESELRPDTVRFVEYFLSDERKKGMIETSRRIISENKNDLNRSADRFRDKLDRYRSEQRRLPEPRRFAPGSTLGKL